MKFRRMLIGLVAAATAVAAGCGGGSNNDTKTVTVEVSDTGYAMPARVAGGAVTMRFRNTGTQLHEFAMGRVDAGHGEAEIAGAVRGAAGGGEPPSWLHDVAGPGLVTPGDEITISRTLEPGTYVLLDGVPDTKGVSGVARGVMTTFAVDGDSGARLPTPDAVITAEKARFVVPALTAGTHTIELRNVSGTGRGFQLLSPDPGKTKTELARWGRRIDTTGKLPAAPPPATFLGAIQTIPTGTSVFLTVDLEAGRTYEVSDDESGLAAEFTPS